MYAKLCQKNLFQSPAVPKRSCKIKLNVLWYSNYFFDIVLYHFLNRHTSINWTQLKNEKEKEITTFEISYVGKHPHVFAKIFQNLSRNFLLCPYHQCTKRAKFKLTSI